LSTANQMPHYKIDKFFNFFPGVPHGAEVLKTLPNLLAVAISFSSHSL
jgi:hypothetical protein